MSDIIFLDIDGVLRTHKSDSEWSEKLNTPIFKRTDRLFSKNSVNDINYITSLTHAKIVVTSSWRIHLSIIELNSIFKKKEYNCRSHWKTEIGLNREKKLKVGSRNYVVIDDQINDIITTIPKCNVVVDQLLDLIMLIKF
jgi:hypothetical protein